jgi:hypothetical protein
MATVRNFEVIPHDFKSVGNNLWYKLAYSSCYIIFENIMEMWRHDLFFTDKDRYVFVFLNINYSCTMADTLPGRHSRSSSLDE